MILFFLIITGKTVLVSGASLRDRVHQTPADMYKCPGDTAELSCLHTIPNYNVVLWYKRSGSGQLQLLGYMFAGSGFPEPGAPVKMAGNADTNKTSTLTFETLGQDSSAVYFCAASLGSFSSAYFGAGTKLTVLKPNRTATPPIVQVLQPSDNECRNRRHNTNKKTLVCVASHFYPDHVSVSWQIEEESVTDGVATDHTALWEGYHYRITSRLRVPLRQWFTPGKRFTCTVSFFNGTGTVYNSNYIEGIEGPGAEAVRAKYLRITHSAKLTYIVLIAKSSIYGAFVVLLVWRLQASSGKQNN